MLEVAGVADVSDALPFDLPIVADADGAVSAVAVWVEGDAIARRIEALHAFHL